MAGLNKNGVKIKTSKNNTDKPCAKILVGDTALIESDSNDKTFIPSAESCSNGSVSSDKTAISGSLFESTLPHQPRSDDSALSASKLDICEIKNMSHHLQSRHKINCLNDDYKKLPKAAVSIRFNHSKKLADLNKDSVKIKIFQSNTDKSCAKILVGDTALIESDSDDETFIRSAESCRDGSVSSNETAISGSLFKSMLPLQPRSDDSALPASKHDRDLKSHHKHDLADLK